MKTITSKTPRETMEIGHALLQEKNAPTCICLFGDLGAGKTTFVKGLGKALGIDERSVKSPTFVSLHEYRGSKGKLYHFDLYRRDGDENIQNEVEEIVKRLDGVVVIEWAEHMKKFLPKQRLDIFFEHGGENTRFIRLNKIS